MRQPIDNCVRNMRWDENSAEKRRLVEELHAPARKNFPRRHVIVRGYDDLWQADIVEMHPYSRFNKGYHYILTVIDVLSKYAWAVPLKSKSGSETANAISEIIWKSGTSESKNLQIGYIGKEFYNADVQRLVNKLGINHYSTYSVMKASVVEQFNRTLKNDMWKMFTEINSTEITSGLTCYRVSCRITVLESIERSVYDPLT